MVILSVKYIYFYLYKDNGRDYFHTAEEYRLYLNRNYLNSPKTRPIVTRIITVAISVSYQGNKIMQGNVSYGASVFRAKNGGDIFNKKLHRNTALNRLEKCPAFVNYTLSKAKESFVNDETEIRVNLTAARLNYRKRILRTEKQIEDAIRNDKSIECVNNKRLELLEQQEIFEMDEQLIKIVRKSAVREEQMDDLIKQLAETINPKQNKFVVKGHRLPKLIKYVNIG
jgi:hypothetical protein